jgi:hypothetical protein
MSQTNVLGFLAPNAARHDAGLGHVAEHGVHD